MLGAFPHSLGRPKESTKLATSSIMDPEAHPRITPSRLSPAISPGKLKILPGRPLLGILPSQLGILPNRLGSVPDGLPPDMFTHRVLFVISCRLHQL